jgi:hypothetical protein
MSKYALAKDQLGELAQRAKDASLDETEVIEALIALGIQELIESLGAPRTREFLKYELDSVSADGFHDIQKR